MANTYKELGVTGLNTSGGQILEEFLPKLRWPKAGNVYQEMSSNDPTVTAILMVAKQLVKNVKWDVEPATSDAKGEADAQFITECMEDMSSTWTNTIDDIMSFFDYGFSYHEIVYKKRQGFNNDPSKHSKYSDNKIGWRKIPGRSQTSLASWDISESGSIQAFNQYTDKGIISIPIEKSLLFRTTAARGNPEGKSFLRGAYRPWYFKKHIEEVEGIGVERDLAGLPMLQAPENIDIFNPKDVDAQKQKTNALNLISSIRRDKNEGVLLPYGWTLELLNSGSSRQFDTSAIINRYDQRIAITMLADIVMLGADKVGSFALAKVKQSMLAAALDAQLGDIADIFNRYAIPRLFALNGERDLEHLPTLAPGDVITPDLKDIGDYIKALTGAKIDITYNKQLEDYLMQVAGFPLMTEQERAQQAKDKEDNKKLEEEKAKQKENEEDPNQEPTEPTDPEDPEKDPEE